jgi:LacI family transcriptional regulator
MATIKDVAKKAGVSISTASYALNGLPKVRDKTRKRVLEAALDLNYYPNGVARNLKMKRTGNVGVFVYGFSGPIFSDVLEGIREKLQENSYNIIVSSGQSSSNLLNERQVDGAIIFDSGLSDDILLNYAKRGFPLILLDRRLEGENIHTSTIDNAELVYAFIKDMQKKGYDTFGYLSGPLDARNNNERYAGFKRALAELGIDDHAFYQADFTIQGGYEEGLKIARSKKSLPRFIFCANDESAIGLIQAFKETKIDIPADVAIAGFDNIDLASYVTPKLTTIGIDHKNWGEHVARAMIRIIEGRDETKQFHPKGMIIMRESC